jgi:hypothetical protein
MALLGLLMSALCSSSARSDAAPGTYTGSIALRGNYYWEESTRVVAPSAGVTLATPAGIRLEGNYLLDAITSASLATGVSTDNAFTEKRNDGSIGLGYEIDFGETQLDVSARARVSKEPDYFSRGAGFGAALSLDQRNTVLRLNGYFIHDEVYAVNRFAPPTSSGTLTASPRIHRGDLDVLSLGLAWDQVLSRSTTVTLGYDLALLNGFQANAYRIVRVSPGGEGLPGATPETHPEQRTRHAPYIWLSHFFMKNRAAIRLGYRLYRDNWGILAHTPEIRLHQEVGPYLELRLRYRYFTQNESFFWRPVGTAPANSEFVTADPKMNASHDQTFGFKVRLGLEFLAFTPLNFLHAGVLDWGVEYVVSNNPYNNNKYYDGFIAQGGLLWPF